jgi:hypothetical protein
LAASPSLDLDIDQLLGSTEEKVDFDDCVREMILLEESDLEALELSGPSRSMAGVQHMRAFHHAIALKLAAGVRPFEICAELAVTPQTVTRLSQDEQFKLLIEGYREKLVDKAIDNFQLMDMVASECLLAMHERVTSSERDEISFEGLRRTAETLVDRTGHSPVRRSESTSRHEHALSASTIDRLKKLHAEDSAYQGEPPKAIEAEVISSHEKESKDSGAAPSISDGFKPVAETEASRPSGPGEGI